MQRFASFEQFKYAELQFEDGSKKIVSDHLNSQHPELL